MSRQGRSGAGGGPGGTKCRAATATAAALDSRPHSSGGQALRRNDGIASLLRRVAGTLLILALGHGVARAEDASPPIEEPPEVSVLTFEPGEEYWQRFGHNALLLRAPDGSRAITYNYGIFDFRQKNFFLNFARGRMRYRVLPNRLANDLQLYESEGRWVQEQKLELTPAQRRTMLDYLETNVRPENAEYGYDYFVSNCSTRVRDAIDTVLGGALKKQLVGKPAQSSYRFEATRLIAPDFPLMLAMDLALGPTADRPIDVWQQSFVPSALMQALRGATVTGADGQPHPLVRSEVPLRPQRIADAPAAPLDLSLRFLLIGLALAVALWMLARRRRNAIARVGFGLLAGSLSLVCGVGGVLLAILWGLTDHWAGWHNENLLVLNPLCLLLVPNGYGAAGRGWLPGPRVRLLAAVVAAAALLALLLRLVPPTFQANLPWVLLLLPSHLTLALIVWLARPVKRL